MIEFSILSIEYIYQLRDARLLNILSVEEKGISRLQKPDKIYLENTNLTYALSNISLINSSFIPQKLFLQHSFGKLKLLRICLYHNKELPKITFQVSLHLHQSKKSL